MSRSSRRSDPAPPPSPPAWHALAASAVLAALGTDARQGLTSKDAARRLVEHGPNRLPEAGRVGPLRRFLKQFHDILIYILLAAAALTAVLGEWLDTAVIALVVVVNAVVGFIQEGKAEEALAGIRKLLSLEATVVRDGRQELIAAEDLVPGDVVRLESGDRVPADLRILSARSARLEEAVLTGESEPVEKVAEPVQAAAGVADRACMAHSGTLVAAGRLAGVVVATGIATQVGRIGELVAGVEGVATPLLRQVERFGRQLSVAIVLGSVAIFAAAWLGRGLPVEEAFLAVVALAVAAIPEGLPAILTITLALGVQRMARQSAIVRRLPAVETLGSVTVTCTDKTGTLTRNEMAVERVLVEGGDWHVSGSGYLPEGDFTWRGERRDPASDPVLVHAIRIGMACNEAEWAAAEGSGGERVLHGDPTEGALLVLAEKAGLDRGREEAAHPRLDLLPFESERRWMATLHAGADGARRLFVKGAPERVLDRCDRVRSAAGDAPLDRQEWERRMEEVAGLGYRLLALAELPAPAAAGELTESAINGGGTLFAVVAIMDPPRPEAAEAVASCRRAGIKVMMVTGDHAATARSIGARMGIGDGSRALTGEQVEAASDDELADLVATHDIVARASPEHKLRIVRALQARGEVCAMTGDGVNDAPALKQADIGVAMGIKGSEAAKGAAEMVLADDNFATIVVAVREGRTVHDNLTKTILFILPTNAAEALVVLAGVLLAFEAFPITPVQVLWVNMITAVTLALALAFEPAEAGIMERPPRAPGSPMLSRALVARIAYVGALASGGCVLLFHLSLSRGVSVEEARTAVVNALVAVQLWYLFSCRFKWRSSVGWQALVGNPAALLAGAILIAVQAALTYLPFMNALFGTRPLPLASWPPVLAVGLVLYLVVEAEKAVGRLRRGAAARGAAGPRGVA